MFANKLSNLDDFLAPSLECIKPMLPNPKIADFEAIDIAPTKKKPDLIKSNADKIA